MSKTASSPLMQALRKKRSSARSARWTVGAYYRAQSLQFWTHALDEAFDEAMVFPKGTVFLVERVEEPSPEDNILSGRRWSTAYVVLKTLDPRCPAGGATLRFGIRPVGGLEIRGEYSLIDEPLVILALAGTGLAL